MTPAETRTLREAAEEAAKRGGEVLRRAFAGPRVISLKGAIDLVTDADRAAEEAVLGFLRKEFPQDVIVAEESSGTVKADQGRRWFVDPLDGTTNYAHGLAHFCTSVALWDGPMPLAAAVYQPLLRELYSAGRDAGATLNGERLAVSGCGAVREALLATGFPYDVWIKPERPLGLFTKAIAKARGIRRIGAAALDLAYVAAGRFDGYFELGLFPWDVAAGILIVMESGGVVSDLAGQPPQLWGREIVASNGKIQTELLRVLA